VPDDQVRTVAHALAQSNRLGHKPSVLHLSGVLELSDLQPLRNLGCAVGSLHPLQSISDPATAPDRLQGAIAVLTGDDRALAAAEELADSMGLTSVRLPGAARAVYHAAAVFASNYVVVLAGIALRLLESTGMSRETALQGLRSLIGGTVENLRRADPQSSLTGPIIRGDAHTIRRHLAALPEQEAELYRLLAHAALSLSDLTPDEVGAIERELAQA
jgi:predicted short-subunit dehydrogenase-like oxidoreductase (DUF2520 family)